ncbi:hypothetical protein [Epilithonimonas hominis]|uniref:hypothetical protein n=1 Tax=Epilithonimonas hominis TaxID=420404 RepID=UPI002898ACAF|nr:hypothetical protein [Epilithonimonas hominis]
MTKLLLTFLLAIVSFSNQSYAQNLSIEETLKYISDNSSTYFNVDSEGYIYNDRYKFHASEVSATDHMSSAVRIMCPSTIISGPLGNYATEPTKCIKCLKKDCYDGTYGGQSSSDNMYINIDSTYDQKRLINAINHLIKKVKEKYPRRGNNDPFAN